MESIDIIGRRLFIRQSPADFWRDNNGTTLTSQEVIEELAKVAAWSISHRDRSIQIINEAIAHQDRLRKELCEVTQATKSTPPEA